MELLLELKLLAENVLESRVIVVELILEFFNIDEVDLALFCVNLHRLKTMVLLQNDLFNSDNLRILHIR